MQDFWAVWQASSWQGLSCLIRRSTVRGRKGWQATHRVWTEKTQTLCLQLDLFSRRLAMRTTKRQPVRCWQEWKKSVSCFKSVNCGCILERRRRRHRVRMFNSKFDEKLDRQKEVCKGVDRSISAPSAMLQKKLLNPTWGHSPSAAHGRRQQPLPSMSRLILITVPSRLILCSTRYKVVTCIDIRTQASIDWCHPRRYQPRHLSQEDHHLWNGTSPDLELVTSEGGKALPREWEDS